MIASPEQARRRAYDLVRDAIYRHGTLRKPTSYDYMDCGEPAECFDHRDYTKPLQVDPVCNQCNIERGSGYPPIGGSDVELTYVLPRKIREPTPMDRKYFRQEFRLSDRELQALESLAKKAGTSKSATISSLIRRAAKRQKVWI